MAGLIRGLSATAPASVALMNLAVCLPAQRISPEFFQPRISRIEGSNPDDRIGPFDKLTAGGGAAAPCRFNRDFTAPAWIRLAVGGLIRPTRMRQQVSRVCGTAGGAFIRRMAVCHPRYLRNPRS